MTTTFVLTLPDQVSDAVEALAARDGLTASARLSGQIEQAYLIGRIALDLEKPRRPSRSARPPVCRPQSSCQSR